MYHTSIIHVSNMNAAVCISSPQLSVSLHVSHTYRNVSNTSVAVCISSPELSVSLSVSHTYHVSYHEVQVAPTHPCMQGQFRELRYMLDTVMIPTVITYQPEIAQLLRDTRAIHYDTLRYT